MRFTHLRFWCCRERPTIDAIAIPLTDPLSGPNRRDASLPYEEKPVLKRNSEPEISSDNPPVSLFGQMPPIVVTRGSGTQYSPRSASSEGKLPSSQENNEKVTGLSNPAVSPIFPVSVGLFFDFGVKLWERLFCQGILSAPQPVILVWEENNMGACGVRIRRCALNLYVLFWQHYAWRVSFYKI